MHSINFVDYHRIEIFLLIMYSEENNIHKIISFELNKNDYLQHLLYSASKTSSVQQKRRRNKIILPIIYLVIGIFGIIQGNLFLVLSMIIMSSLWLYFFPSWEKKQYIKQFNQYLDTHLKDELDKEITLEFSSQEIIQTEKNQKFHITYDQIRGWYETGAAVYIGLMDGYTIIIPKNDVGEIADVKSIVFNNEQNIPILETLDLNWKWE